jgi:hypothetical protein
MEMETLTHWKKNFNTDYIGAYSLLPGEEKIVKIISVGQGMVKGSDGKEKECTVAKLENEKPFILNRTNCKTLTKLFKTPYMEQWFGKRIIVYVDPNVKAFGDTVEALRIKPIEPVLPTLNPESSKWAGAVKALKSGTHTIASIKKSYQISIESEAILLTESKK